MRAVAGLTKLRDLEVNIAMCCRWHMLGLGGAERLTMLGFANACECGASQSVTEGHCCEGGPHGGMVCVSCDRNYWTHVDCMCVQDGALSESPELAHRSRPGRVVST